MNGSWFALLYWALVLMEHRVMLAVTSTTSFAGGTVLGAMFSRKAIGTFPETLGHFKPLLSTCILKNNTMIQRITITKITLDFSTRLKAALKGFFFFGNVEVANGLSS